jgi:hypothetical protein
VEGSYRSSAVKDSGGMSSSGLYLNFRFEFTEILFIPKQKTPWSESVSELYRPSDHRLLAK